MREVVADVGPRVIHSAQIPVQEYASKFIRAPEDQPFIRTLLGVVADELSYRNTKKLRQLLHIPIRETHGGDTTAIRAFGAVDLLFYVLREASELALYKAVPLQMLAETLVFAA